jgi:hypothetical protein
MVERIIYLLGEGATEAEFTHQRKVWFTGDISTERRFV